VLKNGEASEQTSPTQSSDGETVKASPLPIEIYNIMTQAFIDSLAIKIAIFAVFLCMVAVALRRIRWCGEIAHLSSIQPVTCHVHESGIFYAKLPFITIVEGADPSPLLRSILTDDIRCGAITEISGGGDTWWDFTYKGRRFTCKLLSKSEHGSELCRTNCLTGTEEDSRLLQQLVQRIAWSAAVRTGLTCHSVFAAREMARGRTVVGPHVS
jgi:hypothetical protein